MSRYRVSMRGTNVDLRGYIEGQEKLHQIAGALDKYIPESYDPMIIASLAADDYNPFGEEDPEIETFLQAGKKLPEMIGDSSVCIALVTENGPDPKFCIELGYMIALNKPIIVLAHGGAEVPEKLRLVADEIVEWKGELSESGLTEALNRIAEKLTN